MLRATRLAVSLRGSLIDFLPRKRRIAAAEEKFGAKEMFSNLKEAGFTDKQAADYEEALGEIAEDIHAKVIKEETDKETRRHERAKQLQRAKYRERVLQEIELGESEADKAAFALSVISRGKTPQDNPASPVKISKDSILEYLPKEALEKLRSLNVYTTQDTGVHVDEVAPLFGYETGEQLLNVLKEMPKFTQLIEQKVDAAMESELGAKGIDKAEIKIIVEEKLEGYKQEKIWKMELDHLVSNKFAKAKGLITRIAIVSPNVEAYRETARQILRGKSIKEISPEFYRGAMKRAGDASLKALLKGDYITAAKEKRRQLQSRALYAEAKEARKNVGKDYRFLSKFLDNKKRAKIGKAGSDYLEQIDGILEKLNLKRISLKEAERRKSLFAWVQEQKDKGEVIEIPQKLLDAAAKTDYRFLTLQEFSEIAETVRAINTLAELKNSLISEGKKRDLKKVSAEIVSSIQKHNPRKLRPHIDNPNFFQKSLKAIESATAGLTKAEFLINRLDGNKSAGVLWNNVFKPIVDAGRKKFELVQRGQKALDKVFALYDKKEIRELYTKKIHFESIGRTFTKQQIIAIALNMRNEYNKSALLEGEGWTEAQLEEILSVMTKKDWQVSEGIGLVLESYWPEIAAHERRMTGLVPAKVEGGPIVNEHGQFSGGYYPIVFDPTRSKRHAEIEEQKHVLDMYSTGFARAATLKGHTKERTDTGGAPLLLDLSVVARHIDAVSHDLAYREAVINVDKILKHKDVSTAIETAVGTQHSKSLGKWLQAVARDQASTSLGPVGKILSHWRMGVTVVNMGLKMTTSLFQPLGYLQSTKELGYGWGLRGLKSTFLRSPTPDLWTLQGDNRKVCFHEE